LSYTILATPSDLQTLSANKTSTATLASGTVITPGNATTGSFVGSLSTTVGAGGWYSYYCSGFRSSLDTTAGLATFTVADTIKWTAGYKNYATLASTTTIA
jgi:hypothetical protein